MKLSPNETSLKGKSVLKDGHIMFDEVSNRIHELITHQLHDLGYDNSGWDKLFLDPDDGRLWELVYPESEIQGGGAPELHHLNEVQARVKYSRIFGPYS